MSRHSINISDIIFDYVSLREKFAGIYWAPFHVTGLGTGRFMGFVEDDPDNIFSVLYSEFNFNEVLILSLNKDYHEVC